MLEAGLGGADAFGTPGAPPAGAEPDNAEAHAALGPTGDTPEGSTDEKETSASGATAAGTAAPATAEARAAAKVTAEKAAAEAEAARTGQAPVGEDGKPRAAGTTDDAAFEGLVDQVEKTMDAKPAGADAKAKAPAIPKANVEKSDEDLIAEFEKMLNS